MTLVRMLLKSCAMPAGELADGLHLLGLAQLPLELRTRRSRRSRRSVMSRAAYSTCGSPRYISGLPLTSAATFEPSLRDACRLEAQALAGEDAIVPGPIAP